MCRSVFGAGVVTSALFVEVKIGDVSLFGSELASVCSIDVAAVENNVTWPIFFVV